MPRRVERDVLELLAVPGRAQQEGAAAHVAGTRGRQVVGRRGEARRVGDLAAEVERAQEGEGLLDGHPLAAAQAAGGGETRLGREELAGPLAGQAGGGEEEDLGCALHMLLENGCGLSLIPEKRRGGTRRRLRASSRAGEPRRRPRRRA